MQEEWFAWQNVNAPDGWYYTKVMDSTVSTFARPQNARIFDGRTRQVIDDGKSKPAPAAPEPDDSDSSETSDFGFGGVYPSIRRFVIVEASEYEMQEQEEPIYQDVGSAQMSQGLGDFAEPAAAEQPADGKPARPLLKRKGMSVQEFVGIVFDLKGPPKANRLTLKLDEYQLERFAAEQFKKQSRRKLVGKKAVSMTSMISFSDKKNEAPLLERTGEKKKKVAATVWNRILEYARNETGDAAVEEIVALIKDDDELIEETYAQLARQTSACPKAFQMRIWALFLIIASIYPLSGNSYLYICAHLARKALDNDSQIALVASFTFIRFVGRHLAGTARDMTTETNWGYSIPREISDGARSFCCSIYEAMWSQRLEYRVLPVPFVLYKMIRRLADSNAVHEAGLFQGNGSKDMKDSILFEVDKDPGALDRATPVVCSDLLVYWLKELVNPLIPVEFMDELNGLDPENYEKFIGRLPNVHSKSILFLFGFLKEVVACSTMNGMDLRMIAGIFGPVMANTSRWKVEDPNRIQGVEKSAMQFISHMLVHRDTSKIYPIEPGFIDIPPTQKLRNNGDVFDETRDVSPWVA